MKKVSVDWVDHGHLNGVNTHNVSCTISVKDEEWDQLSQWMWDNREHYNGISVMPFFGTDAYTQLPFEDCSEEEYNRLLPFLVGINIDDVREDDGRDVDLSAELACSGGVCDIFAV